MARPSPQLRRQAQSTDESLRARVHLGDCLPWLRALDPHSVDSVVCDPPYGLGFMGKAWDALPPGKGWAEAVLRVVKPGAHLVAFGGTRTVHRLACALEDAGWEIRDTLHWAYWSGFPKSLDVSKAIDAHLGAEREVVGGGFRKLLDSSMYAADSGGGFRERYDITIPATPQAARWEGWGTAVKPAVEPAILARAPLSESSVARNVLRWGTGGLNVDGCRFAPGDSMWPGPQGDEWATHWGTNGASGRTMGSRQEYVPGSARVEVAPNGGRYPANLLHCAKASRAERERGCAGLPTKQGHEAVDRQEASRGMGSPRAGAGRTAGSVRNFHPT